MTVGHAVILGLLAGDGLLPNTIYASEAFLPMSFPPKDLPEN
jgi:hypothetical protein